MYFMYRGESYNDFSELCKAILKKDRKLVKRLYKEDEQFSFIFDCSSVLYSYFCNICANSILRKYLAWKLFFKKDWDALSVVVVQ